MRVDGNDGEAQFVFTAEEMIRHNIEIGRKAWDEGLYVGLAGNDRAFELIKAANPYLAPAPAPLPNPANPDRDVRRRCTHVEFATLKRCTLPMNHTPRPHQAGEGLQAMQWIDAGGRYESHTPMNDREG